MKEELQIRFW